MYFSALCFFILDRSLSYTEYRLASFLLSLGSKLWSSSLLMFFVKLLNKFESIYLNELDFEASLLYIVFCSAITWPSSGLTVGPSVGPPMGAFADLDLGISVRYCRMSRHIDFEYGPSRTLFIFSSVQFVSSFPALFFKFPFRFWYGLM